MKIKKVHLENHPLFDTMDINFRGADGTALDTIIIAGINGTGKTTLLETIFDIGTHAQNSFKDSYLEVDITCLFKKRTIDSNYNASFKLDDGRTKRNLINEKFREIDEQKRPRIIYLPTEINFDKSSQINLEFYNKYVDFRIKIEQDLIKDIPSFIATLINNEVYKNPDFPTQRSIDKVCNEINSLFEILEIDAHIVGLNPEGEKLPIFKNSAGKVFNIKELSSGEKQLFIRAMTLRMLNANNSIILVDEPEISMHPKWQQRIMKVYEKMGENNQIIAATHSPHVVASVPKESVKLLKRENGQIKVVEYDEINGSYGLPVDIVLKELMELDTLRDPEVEKEIRALWDMLHQKKHDTEDFNERYQQLEKLLGSEDEELLLMRIEIAKLRSKREKASVGNKETR
ncbi:MAG: AAA family ATPase [Candidatus Aminicenantes bacterium]|jgi:predicted ATP-binding protein involved in virulence